MLDGLAHSVGGRWGGVVALDLEAEGLAVGEGDGEQQGVGAGSGAVPDIAVAQGSCCPEKLYRP